MHTPHALSRPQTARSPSRRAAWCGCGLQVPAQMWAELLVRRPGFDGCAHGDVRKLQRTGLGIHGWPSRCHWQSAVGGLGRRSQRLIPHAPMGQPPPAASPRGWHSHHGAVLKGYCGYQAGVPGRTFASSIAALKRSSAFVPSSSPHHRARLENARTTCIDADVSASSSRRALTPHKLSRTHTRALAPDAPTLLTLCKEWIQAVGRSCFGCAAQPTATASQASACRV